MKHDLQGWHYLESFEIDGEETPHEVGRDAEPDTFVHYIISGVDGFKICSMIPGKKFDSGSVI